MKDFTYSIMFNSFVVIARVFGHRLISRQTA